MCIDRDDILDYEEWLRAGAAYIEPGDVVVSLLFSNLRPMGVAVRKGRFSGRLGDVLGDGWLVDMFVPRRERVFVPMDDIGLFTKGGRDG